MGKTLYCDCCGFDIRERDKFYRVSLLNGRQRIKTKKEKIIEAFFDESENESLPEYIICDACFAEIGRRVQENSKIIDVEVTSEEEEVKDDKVYERLND